ncbi:MAG: phenylalanine--tRNA ligase subunit alpha, partial [Chloroflexi bacterium]|nr:phenylalanine--tRNA ligase subunit alpha [Chloroflexota bacterium]
MTEDLARLEDQALDELAAAERTEDAGELEQWRHRYLGTQGQVRRLLRSVGQRSPEERRSFGSAAQALSHRLETAYRQTEERLREHQLAQHLAAETVDVTLPGRPPAIGIPHPLRQALTEIVRAFTSLGFQVVEGPEVEWDTY